MTVWASQAAPLVKHLPAHAGDTDMLRPWVGKTPWKRARQPTTVLMPGESHGERSLMLGGVRRVAGLGLTVAT